MTRRAGSMSFEYAITIAAVAAAAIAMSGLLRGGAGGMQRQAGDALGSGQQLEASFLPLPEGE